MRDLLTAFAGAVIVILLAALAVPPFFPWEGQRALVDRAISRSLGRPARSEGRIAVRLLPSPRLRLDRLSLGDPRDAGSPALDLRFVKAEIGLTPLLRGEFRFTETRIGRAEIRLPVPEGDALMLPADLFAGSQGGDLAVDDLRLQQVVITGTSPSTGRTDQVRADDVRLDAPRLTGPWRVTGTSSGLPFRIATGEPAADGRVAVKASGGGDTRPRFDAEMTVGFVPAPVRPGPSGSARMVVPEAEGSVRVVVGPPVQAAGPYLPLSLAGSFTLRGPVATFDAVTAEIDPGGKSLRLSGAGRFDLRNGRAGLTLEARRLDLDAFLISPEGQALIGRGLPAGTPTLPVMVDLDVKADSLALGLDDWSDFSLGLTLDRSGGIVVRRFGVTAPGAATLSASGNLDTQPSLRFTGNIAFDAASSEGLGRYLRKFGLTSPVVAVMDGRPVQASADVSADLSAGAPSLSLRNLRVALGEARITGNARYTKGDAASRGRFDAQLAAQGVDIATLPSFADAVGGLAGHDIGLTLRAADVRFGSPGARRGPDKGIEPGGTIAASIRSDGAALTVDTLEVSDLAGANARLSGRIAPDGSGRIAGRVSAPVAAPLLALLDRVWVAEARLLPAFLRAGALDLAITLEREAGAADTLRAEAKGKAAGSDLDLAVLSRSGRIDGLDATLATAAAGRWLGRDDAGPRQPGRLTIVGRRPASQSATAPLEAAASSLEAAAPLNVTIDGAIAGLTLVTRKPIPVDDDLMPPEAGEIGIESADLTPFLGLALGKASFPVTGPVPAALSLGLARSGEDARLTVSGRIAGNPVSANLVRAPSGEIGGSLGLSRLSLPWLASALVLPADPKGAASADTALSGARFAPAPERPPLTLAVRADALDLGRGFQATGTAMNLRLSDTTLALDDLSGTLAGGRLIAAVSIARRGGAASVSGEGRLDGADLAGLSGPGPIAGRVSASLRFGASGESVVALHTNLGGSGSLTLSELRVPEADPKALGRAVPRALDDEDPLREGRLKAIVAEALSAGPMTAKGPVTVPATIVGGTLRATPLVLDLDGARWAGSLALDLRDGRIDARGTLTDAAIPKGWSAGPPAVQLGLAGSLAKPERSLDVGPLTNGLAAFVLQRELEKIELFEADQSERQRRRARIEMDRARSEALKLSAERAAVAEKAAAERAAIEKAAAEKAAVDRAAVEKAMAERVAAERAAAEKAAADKAAADARNRPPEAPPVPAEPNTGSD